MSSDIQQLFRCNERKLAKMIRFHNKTAISPQTYLSRSKQTMESPCATESPSVSADFTHNVLAFCHRQPNMHTTNSFCSHLLQVQCAPTILPCARAKTTLADFSHKHMQGYSCMGQNFTTAVGFDGACNRNLQKKTGILDKICMHAQ